jgi:hypothetical protein
MSRLILNKNFGNLLASKDFLPDSVKVLSLRIHSKKGHIIKKQVNETDKLTIIDIKTVESATFGKDDVKIDVLEKINYIISIETSIESLKTLNKLFISFCKAFLKVLCPRCYIKENKVNGINPHNTGKLNLLFLNCHPSYFNNIFDGMIKCFIAFLINEDQNIIPDKKGRWIETFAHIVSDIKENASEKQLHFVYSNIIHNYFTGKLTSNNAYQNIEQKMKEDTSKKIKTFYTYMYPALKYFNEHKKDIFIRHGLEKNCDNYSKNMTYPPNDNNNGWRIHKVTNAQNKNISTALPAYPIEFDSLPLRRCSSHSVKEIYGNVKGFIARTSFKQNGGVIHIRYDKDDNIMAREHLFAESDIDIKQWVFTYKHNCHDSVKDQVKTSIRAIIMSNIPLVSEEVVSNLFSNLELLTNKFIMLH